MANFDACVNWILQQEDRGLSGKVVNLFDGEGLTRYGIGQTSNPNLPLDFYTCLPAKALGYAKDFYRSTYWNKFLGDLIQSDEIAATILSFSVNIGLNREIMMLQQVLGFTQTDGIMGPLTLAATNNSNPATLAPALRTAQANFYKMLVAKQPTDARFLTGWLRRASLVFPELS